MLPLLLMCSEISSSWFYSKFFFHFSLERMPKLKKAWWGEKICHLHWRLHGKWKMCMVYNGFVRYSLSSLLSVFLWLEIAWNYVCRMWFCVFLNRHLHSTFLLSSFSLIWNSKSLQWSCLAFLCSKSVKITIHCILLLAFLNLTFLVNEELCYLCACNDFRMKMLLYCLSSLKVAKQWKNIN